MKFLLSLILAAALAAPALAAPAPKDPVASPELQKEFNSFIEKFRAAVKANDPAAVAGMSKMPFLSHTDEYGAAEFRDKVYKTNFTPKVRACLQRAKAVYGRDGEKNDNFFINCGDAIYTFTKAPAGFQFTEIGAND
jgi:hypothetical protein